MGVRAGAAPAAEAATPAEKSSAPKMKIKKDQVAKAVRALAQVVKKKQVVENKLFDSTGETMTVIFTLGVVPDKKRMRPFMIQLPHPMFDETSEVCFFSKSPQKPWKDMLVREKKVPGISKVIGLDKLQRNYKTLEAKKALCDSFDLFLCDAAIAEKMPHTLGKIFYSQRNKAPLPIRMERQGVLAEHFKRAIGGTALRIPNGPCLGVKIGHVGMPEESLEANAAVVITAVAKILHEHKNYVQSISIQATNAPALPVWERAVTPGGLYKLSTFKKERGGDTTSSAASETGSSFASDTEALDISEMPSDAGETLSTRDTVSEQETMDDTTHSEMDTEAGNVDSESAPEKQEMPLLKGLKKRAKRRLGADDGAAAAAAKRAAAEVAPAPTASSSMPPPPAKKQKKQNSKAT